MGVVTRGVILTPFKDVFAICSLAERAINKVINEEKKLMFPGERPWSSKCLEFFANAKTTISPESELLDCSFRFQGENRALKIFLGCDCDNAELGPKSLSLSLGLWGSSELLVKTVLHALSVIGPAYFDLNDSDDVDLAPMAEKRPNLLQAVKLGYMAISQLEDWKERLPFLGISNSEIPEFLGCSEKSFCAAINLEDYELRREAIKHLVNSVNQPRVNFIEEFHQMTVAQDADLTASNTG